METKHKEFKPYDKVLVKVLTDERWTPDLYSYYDDIKNLHWSIGCGWASDENILPYEGNEELVGSDQNPDEEIELMEGTWVMVCDETKDYAAEWNLRSLMYAQNDEIMIQSVRFAYGDVTGYKYAIRFSDFNPNDMEETKKHILRVKNGKIVKLKN